VATAGIRITLGQIPAVKHARHSDTMLCCDGPGLREAPPETGLGGTPELSHIPLEDVK